MDPKLEKWMWVKNRLRRRDGFPKINQGEIWWASIGENVGIEINGKSNEFIRPVIIYKKLSIFGALDKPVLHRDCRRDGEDPDEQRARIPQRFRGSRHPQLRGSPDPGGTQVMANFHTRLEQRIAQCGNPVCLGMDPVLKLIDPCCPQGSAEEKIKRFYSEILEEALRRGVTPAVVKPNSAYYE